MMCDYKTSQFERTPNSNNSSLYRSVCLTCKTILIESSVEGLNSTEEQHLKRCPKKPVEVFGAPGASSYRRSSCRFD
jgi:hypothetical protein